MSGISASLNFSGGGISSPGTGGPGSAVPETDAMSTPGLSATSPWETILTRLRQVTDGEFEVGRELGRGGMAAVFLARDVALNRRVAVKVMAPGLMMGEGMVQRFRQEAITIANLSHAHIVSIFAVRQLQDLHFFVMQFVEGQSLETVLRTHGRLPLPVVKAILFQVGSALAYAHRRGVIHRDIKPANILMSGDGDALVTDFGIAKVAEGPTQTQTGMVVGTPTYMSPEQCYASDLDGTSDQYSLGIVAYQMLTGQTPFSGPAFSIMKGHTTDPVPSMRALAPDVPEEVEAAVLRMLAKTPAERFASFGDALQALDAKAVGEGDPLRQEMIQLAAVEERRAVLGSLLHTPSGPQSSARGGSGSRPGTAAAAPPPPTVPVTVVAIAPLPEALEPGDEITVRANVRGGANSPALRWSVTAPDCASVDAETGVLTALAEGTGELLATVGDVTERTPFTVVAPKVAAITVTVPSVPLHVGDQARLAAQPVDKRERPLDREVEWSAVGPSVTIQRDGAIQCIAEGRTAITVACDGVFATEVLQVRAARVSAVEIASPALPLEIGHAITMSALTRDAKGGVLDGRAVAWTVTPAERARIDAAGVCTPLSEGAITVRATSEGISAERALTIPPARAANVVIGNVPDLVRSGDRFTLRTTARDARGVELKRAASWASDAPDIASVDSTGSVVVHKSGAVGISATVDDVSTTAQISAHDAPKVFTTDEAKAAPAASATEVLSAMDAAAPPAAPPAAARPAAAAVAPGLESPLTAKPSAAKPNADKPNADKPSAATSRNAKGPSSTSKSGKGAKAKTAPTSAAKSAAAAAPVAAAPAAASPVGAASAAQGEQSSGRPMWMYGVAALAVVAVGIFALTGGDDAPVETGAPAGSSVAADVGTAGAPANANGSAADGAGTVVASADTPADSTAAGATEAAEAGEAAAASTAPATNTTAPAAEQSEAASTPATAPAPEWRMATPSNTTPRVGETVQLRVTARDPASGRAVTVRPNYRSSNTDVASVSNAGVVTAKAPGTVTITALDGSQQRARVQLRVQPAVVAQQEPAANAAASTPPATSPPAATTPPPAATPATPVVSQQQLASEARQVIQSFASAVSSRDIAAVRRVYPGISGTLAQSYEDVFGATKSMSVTLGTVRVVGGGQYNADVGSATRLLANVVIRLVPERGTAPPPSNDEWPVTLERTASGWRLVTVADR